MKKIAKESREKKEKKKTLKESKEKKTSEVKESKEKKTSKVKQSLPKKVNKLSKEVKKSTDSEDEKVTISDDEKTIKLSGKKDKSRKKQSESDSDSDHIPIKVVKNPSKKMTKKKANELFEKTLDIGFGETIIANTKRGEKSTVNLSTLSFIPDEKITDRNLINCSLLFGMKDVATKGLLPDKTDIACRNCTEPFTTKPIGAPIRYVPCKIQSKYKSEYNGTEFVSFTNTTMTDIINMTKIQKKKEEKEDAAGGKTFLSDNIITRDYFDTLYMFCGIPCIIRYAHDHRTDIRFKNTIPLLRMMIKKMGLEKLFPTSCIAVLNNIGAAPPVDKLTKFGGPMDIVQYRKISNTGYPFIVFRETPFLATFVIKNEIENKKKDEKLIESINSLTVKELEELNNKNPADKKLNKLREKLLKTDMRVSREITEQHEIE